MPILLSANSTAINLLQVRGKQFAFPAVRASPDERTADGKAEWRTVRQALRRCQRTAILKSESTSPEKSMVISTSSFAVQSVSLKEPFAPRER